jgi:hypothetical protein
MAEAFVSYATKAAARQAANYAVKTAVDAYPKDFSPFAAVSNMWMGRNPFQDKSYLPDASSMTSDPFRDTDYLAKHATDYIPHFTTARVAADSIRSFGAPPGDVRSLSSRFLSLI